MPETIAILFDRFGPYHVARIKAASQHNRIFAIEVCAKTREYEWQKVDCTGIFESKTLFTEEEGDSRDITTPLIRRRIDGVLNCADPIAVLIPGWSTPAALVALRWCLHANRPAIVMSESTRIDERRRWSREWVKRRIAGLFSAGLVGGSPQKDYLTELGLPGEKIFTGYDVVDNKYFRSKAEEARAQNSHLRQKYGLPNDYFLASARFVEKKNLFTLVRAYANYRNSVGSNAWGLVLLGDGPLKSDLSSLVSELNLDDSVVMPGFKQYDELPVYYGLANVFVHASTTEQWGLVVNEAMASGLPVLVSNRCGCAVDLVKNGKNGFTFDPYQVAGLTRRMLEMTSMKGAALAAMGEVGRNIIKIFSPETFAEGAHLAIQAAQARSVPRLRSIDSLILNYLISFQ